MSDKETGMNIAVASPRSAELVASFTAVPRKLLVGGKWLDAQSGKTFPVYNPANGRVFAQAAEAGEADVALAVSAAREALERGSWSKMSPSERARLLWKLADAVETHAEELALIETLDNGKPFAQAKAMDIAGSAERMRYYAGWATKLNGETLAPTRPGNWHAYTLREPIGVVGLILPWNAPLLMAASKMAPALAAGCTVVVKPAEQTPLSALRLGELAHEVGFPDGIINIVTGFGETAGAALVEHPDVNKISFTGSTAVGKRIVKASTGNLKRVTLELGGKSPIIVFPDADLERAIPAAAGGIFANSGQVCAANSRLYAHQDVFDRVVEGIARHAERLKIGPGTDPDTDLGPLISQEQFERVVSYLQSGIHSGAQPVTGGKPVDRNGYFVEPTIFTDIRDDMPIMREEIFGPVLCASAFIDDDLDQIAARANDTVYGLTAYVWTNNLGIAHKMAKKLKAGTVHVNGRGLDVAVPFGGYKQSGWGRENAREGIDIYTETKSVVIAL
jgi:phenylacetaldehyde dehydrogenase